MPFFWGILKKIKNLCVTLQVRILIIKLSSRRKKVSFSACASLTLEAALVLPLFLYGGVILMMPLQIMDIHRQVLAEAEHVSETISQAACLVPYEETETFWNTAAAYAYGETAIRTGLGHLPVRQISLLRSSLLGDGETVDLVVDYQMELPFSVLGLKSIKQTARSYRRAWVGQEGRSQKDREAGEGEEDVTVYIGKNSTRYHVSSTCHYLHNDLKKVSAGEVRYCRNEEGRAYEPCARCGSQAGGMVYLMPSGRHYHSTPACSAINAYVQAVKKSQVAYLGVCSYCGRKK